MKVIELVELLKKQDPTTQVVIQRDEAGWHTVDEVAIVDGEDDDKLVSINWIE